MAIFKCKMCGGTLEFNPGDTVAVCDSCGTKQTLPKLDDEKRANLYDRANHFRRNNEFDKAIAIYEQILNEDRADAEAYWSMLLCRYGIEYVEDPSTHKRVPTVNRAQYTSVFDDEDYKSALANADGYQKEVYEAEAKEINEIQKGILAISQKEEPFDVFICYKETDNSGRRTQDSVLANDLYHQLTQEGFKVFFSRITLEDKLGSAYEPYIFAALNSAKVMVVIGTKPEYLSAVWVKNEWGRYLALIKNGAKKVLIPAYRDMDPYDLPEEFSHLQAQDMSKLGFMQDIIRGIKKITAVHESKTVVKETVAANQGVAPLLKRAFMFLEDGDWNNADEYCEKVLDIDPECAEAYLGKLMAGVKVKKREKLADCSQPFDEFSNYQKAVRFGGDKMSAELEGYVENIKTRNENARLAGIYAEASQLMSSAKTEGDFKAAAAKFKTILGFKSAKYLSEECLENAEAARKDSIYSRAKVLSQNDVIAGIENSIALYESISGWKDAGEQIDACRRRIEELKAEEERRRLEKERRAEEAKIAVEKRKKQATKIAKIGILSLCALIAFLIVLNTVIIPANKYKKAVTLCDAGSYAEAASAFLALGDYKDSADKMNKIINDHPEFAIYIANVGDIVTFGNYEQDNVISNGKEAIEWLVLAKDENRALLISKYCLDCQQYNTEDTDVTWETCTLRKWMNSDFFNAAFADAEKAMIPTVTISTDYNPEYSTDPGNATQDKVFLLSITQANAYFDSDASRQCVPTDYAVAQGAFINSDNGNWWWLRSPGDRQYYAAFVDYYGGVYGRGDDVYYDGNAVRPALWIDLNS